MANKNLKSIKFPGLSDTYVVPQVDTTLTQTGRPADAKATGDAISALGDSVDTEIDALKEDLFSVGINADVWELGGISYGNGANAASNARVRTKTYLDDSVVFVRNSDSTSFKMALYAWNASEGYAGCYNGTAFINTGTNYYSSFDLTKIRKTYSGYKFRVVIFPSNTSDTTIDYDSAVGSVLFTKTVFAKSADINIESLVPIPSLWEPGGISYTNGLPAVTSARIRTNDYIPDDVNALVLANKNTTYGYKSGVYAWDENGTYIGMLKADGTFAKATTWIGDVDFVKLRSDYPTYKFKAVASNQNDSSAAFGIVNNFLFDRTRFVEKDNLFVESSNLFDYNTAIFGQINTTSGAIESSNTNKVSALIKIKPSTKYTYSQTYTRIAYYDESLAFISSEYSDGTGIYTVTTPANAEYCRLITNAGKTPLLQLNEGETLLPYEEYYRGIIKQENIKKENKSYAFSAMPIPTTHNSVTCEAIDGSGQYDDSAVTVAQVYGWYDALVEAYPDYVTKHDWGMDASNTYNIYSYSFIPEALEDNNNLFGSVKTYPKMLLRGGCHGNGTSGDHTNMIHALYFLLYDVCHNHGQNDFLTYLRYNVQLEVLPLMNPWGVQNKSRKNSNGVDINRNFSYGWALGSSSSADYGGTAPFTEAESIAIRSFVNANLDAFCDIEFHAVSREYQTQPHMMYFDTVVGSEMYYVNRSVIVELTQKWKNEEHGGLTDIPYYGYIDGTVGAGQVTSWITHESNIPSTILEGFPNYESSGYTTNSIEIMGMCLDEVNCIILSAIRFFGQMTK